MLALCLVLSVTYYAHNYAGIIGWSLMGSINGNKWRIHLGNGEFLLMYTFMYVFIIHDQTNFHTFIHSFIHSFMYSFTVIY